MKGQTMAGKAFGRACSLIAAGIAAVALTSPAAAATTGTYQFGYENGFEGWTAKTDETAGAPDCDGRHGSSVLHSADKPHNGTKSLDFKLRSPHDCGLAYVDRKVDAGTTAPVRVTLSFWLWSPDYDGGTGGTFKVLAHAGTGCVIDPHWDDVNGGWADFVELGSAGHAEGPGWYNYRLQAAVTPDANGQICVSQGIKLSSTTGEDFKHYYFDDTRVTVG
ncbi:hypothetical protein [Kibdelosporangium phytohabitans]|uniref:Uncharacterized protein n=1 Tax=Kibdelosporangium phytohabitans TaxID=860235 RepID=A0A0N9I6S6_9PSEU|nr:hypothetical protein [Kibdelosporangium phytohabitans]ALG10602.1 hypothetical protein AOZ06_30205 [Kibdelosporangium phytohabitans]MBE1461714.1 hypothetical protein [Kibdelosporangium phytohabitans]